MKTLLKIIESIIAIPFCIILGTLGAIIIGIPLFIIYLGDIVYSYIWGYSNGC